MEKIITLKKRPFAAGERDINYLNRLSAFRE
jgi:hypothetical protein